MEKRNKKAQLAIFVIIAIIIVAGIGGYFILRDRVSIGNVPSEFQPIYDYYLSCIESNVEDGVSLIGTQGGYIETPEFEPGSEYAPFSSQLDFLGFGVPYWYYISQNGLVKEQIPTLSEVEGGLDSYLEEEIVDCDFTDFRRQGYEIELKEARVSSDIQEQKINVNVQQSISISKGEGEERVSVVITNHNVEKNSKLGRFYEIAREVYKKQAEDMLLENYAVDTLNLYAPVTGTEITCSPLIWSPYEVIDDIQKGLNANIQMLRLEGEYYDSNEVKDYYIIENNFDLEDEQISFMYNPEWPSRFEIWPTENNVMIADVVGPSQGLGVAGFCYVSYKYVYDMYFPVLIQVTSLEDSEEIFQFPVAVVVSKNQPREAINVEGIGEENEIEICENSNVEVSIYTYNNFLDSVEANITYQCFTDSCNLGQTIELDGEAVLETKVPACSNGLLIANAPGYKESKTLFSSNENSFADIILEDSSELELEVYVDGRLTNNLAVLTITENKEDSTTEGLTTIAYPYNPNLELASGDYIFDLKVFSDKKLTLPESSEKKCIEVPKEGVLGIFGLKEDKCYDYNIPSQEISTVLYAGGEQNYYVSQSELVGARTLRVYAESVPLPSKVEELQNTYNLIEVKDLEISII